MMNNKKVIFIGSIKNRICPSGPESVIFNLLKECEKDNINFKFINTYCINIKDKFKLLIKLATLVFSKNKIINVHTFGYKVSNIVLFLSKINKKNDYYLTFHGIMSLEGKYLMNNENHKEYMGNKKYYDKLEKKIVTQFPNIICVSNSQKNFIKKVYSREEGVFVIHNGININEKYDINANIKDKHKLIMAGGIFSIKGIFETIDFISCYNRKNKDKLYISIYGGIESKQLLQEFNDRLKKLNMSKFVTYLGKITHEELLNEFEKSYLCLAFSRLDTFNLTVLESMSVGTPAIVSIQSGVSELITDEKNGFVIDVEGDYINRTNQIIKFLVQNDEFYKEICKEAYNVAESNRWSKVYKEYKRIFNESN